MQVDIIRAAVRFGSMTVFSEFTAHIPPRKITALVGPSGSGKSTLLAAISGELPLAEGRVEVRPDTAHSSSIPSAEFVAWVPQGSNSLGRRSVIDNVAIASLATGATLPEAYARSREVLEVVGIGDLQGQQARHLSGGELQRLALARALATGKELILADEPSANLDAANTTAIARVLNDLRSTVTIIVATHDPILASVADVTVRLRGESSVAA